MDNKGGRPSSYKQEYAEQAYKLCLLGFTDKQLAEFFETTEQTINNWKHKHPKFFESVKKAKQLADADVAVSFHKKATGYRYDEVHQEHRDSDLQVVRVVTKEVSPDARAALNWLKNRQPSLWREKPEPEQNSGVQVIGLTTSWPDLKELSDEELEVIAKGNAIG